MGAFQLSVWLCSWGFVGASVVIASTSGEPATVIDVLLQSVGSLYLSMVATLEEFAELTAISPRWTDVGYAVLALIPFALHVYLSVRVNAQWEDDIDAGDFIFFIASLGGVLAFLVGLLFGLGAQVLSVSILAVGIGVVMETSYHLRKAVPA